MSAPDRAAARPPEGGNLGADMAVGRFGSGHAVRRIEDPALVQGQGRYTDDVAPEGQLFVRFVRSTQAHGRITAIDTAAAAAMPGVVAVYTGPDLEAAGVKPLPAAAGFKRPDGQAMSTPPKRALAVDVVRYVGEPVAVVVAGSRAAARAAADAVLSTAPPAAVRASASPPAVGASATWPSALFAGARLRWRENLRLAAVVARAPISAATRWEASITPGPWGRVVPYGSRQSSRSRSRQYPEHPDAAGRRMPDTTGERDC